MPLLIKLELVVILHGKVVILEHFGVTNAGDEKTQAWAANT